MQVRRSRSLRFFSSLLLCVLICAIGCAELPELLSLIDDTSNDYVVLKSVKANSTNTVSLIVEARLINLGQDLRLPSRCPSPRLELQQAASDLFIVNSTLRI